MCRSPIYGKVQNTAYWTANQSSLTPLVRTEGVQRMKVGGKAKLVCPPAIAYGERGANGVIPPNATLLFEIELLDIAHR